MGLRHYPREGRISFHDWIGNSWCVRFSHRKDFTPVCTTELGYMARIKPEFDRRNVRIIGLSVDTVDDHARWTRDMEDTQGIAPNYPIIGDPDLRVSKLYGMLPAATPPAPPQAARPPTTRPYAPSSSSARSRRSSSCRSIR